MAFTLLQRRKKEQQLVGKKKPNTILGIMRHLRKMIKLAIGEEIITHDLFEGYSPERPKAEPEYLNREELNKIITTPLDHP